MLYIGVNSAKLYDIKFACPFTNSSLIISSPFIVSPISYFILEFKVNIPLEDTWFGFPSVAFIRFILNTKLPFVDAFPSLAVILLIVLFSLKSTCMSDGIVLWVSSNDPVILALYTLSLNFILIPDSVPPGIDIAIY